MAVAAALECVIWMSSLTRDEVGRQAWLKDRPMAAGLVAVTSPLSLLINDVSATLSSLADHAHCPFNFLCAPPTGSKLVLGVGDLSKSRSVVAINVKSTVCYLSFEHARTTWKTAFSVKHKNKHILTKIQLHAIYSLHNYTHSWQSDNCVDLLQLELD